MNEKSEILELLKQLEAKVDALSNKQGNPDRLDSDTVAMLTAAVYSIFGTRAAMRSVRLIK